MFLDSWGIGLRPFILQNLENHRGLRNELGEELAWLNVVVDKWQELVYKQVVREGNELPSPDYLSSPSLVAGDPLSSLLTG